MKCGIGIAVVAALMVSCSSTKKIEVVSSPPGATVRIDGVKIGVTPTEVEVGKYDPVELSVEKAGYCVQSVTLEPKSSTMEKILWSGSDPKVRSIKEDKVEVTLYKLQAPKIQRTVAPARKERASEAPTLRQMPDFL